MADQLAAGKVSNCDRRQLYRYLRFFRAYPQIVGTLSPQSDAKADIVQLLTRLSSSHIEELVRAVVRFGEPQFTEGRDRREMVKEWHQAVAALRE